MTKEYLSGYLSLSFLMLLTASVLLMHVLLGYYSHIAERWQRHDVRIRAERMAFQQLEMYPDWITYDKKDWRVTLRREDNTFIIVRVCYRNVFCIEQKRINPMHRINSKHKQTR